MVYRGTIEIIIRTRLDRISALNLLVDVVCRLCHNFPNMLTAVCTYIRTPVLAYTLAKHTYLSQACCWCANESTFLPAALDIPPHVVATNKFEHARVITTGGPRKQVIRLMCTEENIFSTLAVHQAEPFFFIPLLLGCASVSLAHQLFVWDTFFEELINHFD